MPDNKPSCNIKQVMDGLHGKSFNYLMTIREKSRSLPNCTYYHHNIYIYLYSKTYMNNKLT